MNHVIRQEIRMTELILYYKRSLLRNEEPLSSWHQVNQVQVVKNNHQIFLNLAESCRILQNLAESCRILQSLAESYSYSAEGFDFIVLCPSLLIQPKVVTTIFDHCSAKFGWHVWHHTYLPFLTYTVDNFPAKIQLSIVALNINFNHINFRVLPI